MIVRDEALLALFRLKPRCEWCDRRRPVEPHHLFARGMGGSTRLDVPYNLIALCRECHHDTHQGHILRSALLALVAAREGRLQADIEDELYRLRRVR